MPFDAVRRRRRAQDIALFTALFATALALGAALAHLLALPNKMAMARDAYFVAQQAYAGWDRLAILLAVQLVAIVASAVIHRNQPRVLWLVLIALLCLLLAQALFWTFTFPANGATRNWTRIPPDWAEARARWEYSHAGGALLQMGAMAALIVAALTRRPR
jgi:hypothetical protein